MKRYSYFPGCSSSEGTAVAYGESAKAISAPLGMELVELEDWNCCGATPYFSTKELESLCVATRNLALAEKAGMQLVTPCSACYSVLNRANTQLKKPKLKSKVDECLAAAGLEYKGNVKVRHLFEVIYTDVGPDSIKAKVTKPLSGLKVAPYYGCQMVRPDALFDNQDNPQSFERLLASLGVEPVAFPLKTRCCGGSLVISELDLTLGLIRQLLESAAQNGAQCIATVCPLCYTILDAYQGMVNGKFLTNFKLPVFFFTQLIGLALGIAPKQLALEKGAVSAEKVLASI